MYSTVRLRCGASVGTGFFFHATLHGRSFPLLLTNRHVIAPDDPTAILATPTQFGMPLSIQGHKSVVVGDKASPAGVAHSVDVTTHNWFGHPDPSVDLAALPVASIPAIDRELFHTALQPGHIPTEGALGSLSMLEDITMCGAPTGLWDDVNGLPVFRRGTTASHPAVDHRGKREGLVDIACFPGSSGSPLCVINEGAYPDKLSTGRNGAMLFGNRLLLLGVLFAGPLHNAEGVVVAAPLPTTFAGQTITPQMIHLGYYLKASRITELVRALESVPIVDADDLGR